MAIKFDIKKAFDTIDWDFLHDVLTAFGFNATFCNWIKIILNYDKLSFSVNGRSIGYFSYKRGVRQGVPLSPLIFCIAEDVLSRGIGYLVNYGSFHPMTGPRGFSAPSYTLYVDSILVFYKGTTKILSLSWICSILIA